MKVIRMSQARQPYKTNSFELVINLNMHEPRLADHAAKERDARKEQPPSFEQPPSIELLQKYLCGIKMDDIGYCLEHNLEDAFYDMLSDAGKAMISIRRKDNYFAIEAYFKFALCLLSAINKSIATDCISHRINIDYLSRVIDFASWDEAVSYLHEVSMELFKYLRGKYKRPSNYIVNNVRNYVVQHLEDDLSLIKLADRVYLHPTYLSRLFRKNTGIKLSEYIESSRVAKAKVLLEIGNAKIYDVARAVGYDTAGSFTRFFRKSTGYSPQEYRMLIKNSNN